MPAYPPIGGRAIAPSLIELCKDARALSAGFRRDQARVTTTMSVHDRSERKDAPAFGRRMWPASENPQQAAVFAVEPGTNRFRL